MTSRSVFFAGGRFLAAFVFVLAVQSQWLAASERETIPGIGPVGEIVKVHGDFVFTEGPADDGKGGLYFSDVRGNRLHKTDGAGKLSTLLDPSNHSNGLMVNAAGTLFACVMDGRLVSVNPADKKVTVLAGEYNGKRFNAPNDLVLDKIGGVYFTDPRFLAPEPWPQGVEAVYYRAADGKVTRLMDDLPAPNGVILSPDEKTLYVIPSLQKEMMAYILEGPGKPGKGRVFCSLKQPDGTTGAGGGGDGLTIDTKGNLYITSRLGVQVFNAEGKLLGIIEFPEQPSNCTFGGKDRKTLYVTARTSVYAAPMEATGHAFPGAK
jgi:gluconolactonase